MKNGRPALALVGYGAIAQKHLEVFRHLDADIVASCNRSEKGRERARLEGGVPRAYSDVREMMERERPDGVIVCPSVLSVFSVASELMGFRVPMLLEKPAGTSLRETEALAARARESGTPVMVGLNRRFYSVYHRALESIGGPTAVTAVSVEWSEDPARMRELGHPEAVVRALNFANSLHGLDLLVFLAGRSRRFEATGRDLGHGSAELRWQMILQGESEAGASLLFTSTWDAPGRWRLVFDSCGSRVTCAPLETALVLTKGRPTATIEPSEEDQRFKPGFHGQAVAFLSLVRDHKIPTWPACSIGDALVSAEYAERLTEACMRQASRFGPGDDGARRC